MHGFDQNLKIYLKDNNPRLPCWQSDSWPSPQHCLRQPLLSKSLPVDVGAQKPHPLQLLSHRAPELRAEKSRSASTWVSGEGLPLSLFTAKENMLVGPQGLSLYLPFHSASSCVARGEEAFLLTTHPGRSHPLGRGGHATKGSLLICSCWDRTPWRGWDGGTSVTCIWGEGSCLSEAPGKTQKGKPHICCGNKEWDFCSVTGLEHGNLSFVDVKLQLECGSAWRLTSAPEPLPHSKRAISLPVKYGGWPCSGSQPRWQNLCCEGYCGNLS